VDVTLDGVTHRWIRFLVFNRRTYPNLVALFRLLGVQSVASEMSFASAWTKAAWNGRAAAWRRCSRRRRTWPGRPSGACCRTSCASTARPRAWTRGGGRRGAGRVPDPRGYGEAFGTGTCCPWRLRSGPARPGRCSNTRSSPSSISAATTACSRSGPAELADVRARPGVRPRPRPRHPRPAPGHAGRLGQAPPFGHPAGGGRAHRALRRRGLRLPLRPTLAILGQDATWRSAPRSARCATSRTARCCTPTSGCCPSSGGVVGLELPGWPRDPDSARHGLLPDQPAAAAAVPPAVIVSLNPFREPDPPR